MTQIWVCLYGLAHEYWWPKILFSIASCIGSPIHYDITSTNPMIDGSFGHFVRVLVDMDVTKKVRYRIMVERHGYTIFY